MEFFSILFVLSIPLVIVGLIKPTLVIRWGDPSKRNRKKVLLVFLGIFLISFIGFSVTYDKTAATTPSAQNQEVVASKEPPPKKEEWHDIKTITGKSTKQTETFNIPSKEWVIAWKTEPGEHGPMNFIINVHKPNGTLTNVAANVIGASNEYTVMHEGGDFYLSINTSQPYAITIRAKY